MSPKIGTPASVQRLSSPYQHAGCPFVFARERTLAGLEVDLFRTATPDRIVSSDETEAQILVLVLDVVLVPVRATNVPRVVVPAAAANHPRLDLRLTPIALMKPGTHLRVNRLVGNDIAPSKVIVGKLRWRDLQLSAPPSL